MYSFERIFFKTESCHADLASPEKDFDASCGARNLTWGKFKM